MARRIAGGITVTNLFETIEAAQAAERGLRSVVFREFRGALRPMVADIKDRFRQLGGTGPRVATTVRSQVSSRGVGVLMGNAQHPYSLGREFGAKRGQTRPFFRRVQSGALTARAAGGGARRVLVARIPYLKDSIFGPWTGNQFQLGESGDRLTIEKSSGKAFYPGIGVGAQHMFEQLKSVAEGFADSFPTTSQGSSGSIERMQSFLKAGGIGV